MAEILNLDAGQPSGLYRKDVLPVGHYVHPRTGQTVDVDLARLNRWKANFDAMRGLIATRERTRPPAAPGGTNARSTTTSSVDR